MSNMSTCQDCHSKDLTVAFGLANDLGFELRVPLNPLDLPNAVGLKVLLCCGCGLIQDVDDPNLTPSLRLLFQESWREQNPGLPFKIIESVEVDGISKTRVIPQAPICQRCQSSRLCEYSGEFGRQLMTTEGLRWEGDAPMMPNIAHEDGGGFYLKFCLDCGQLQGTFPITPEQVQTAMDSSED